MAGQDMPAADDTISLVQRGNLKTIETTLRKQWRLGQNIVLCWSATDNGLLLLMVPHYFLGNFTASTGPDGHNTRESFVRRLISGRRRKQRDEFFEISERLGVSANFIKLPTPLEDEPAINSRIEEIIRRYGISYVASRAVLLFDIAQFSLYTPFEQASQLNSLSYSMNSAYNKLLTRGIEVNFARTTTGDGYYVWNRDLSPSANEDLLHFLLLVIADNSMARKASKGNTVPLIRTAFHIGSHYELYQATSRPSCLHRVAVTRPIRSPWIPWGSWIAATRISTDCWAYRFPGRTCTGCAARHLILTAGRGASS